MKTLVFAFDVAKLDDAELQDFMQRLFDAQKGVPLGLCKYNVFDTHSVRSVHDKLDELRSPDGEEIGGEA